LDIHCADRLVTQAIPTSPSKQTPILCQNSGMCFSSVRVLDLHVGRPSIIAGGSGLEL
jgi:hypothetical protein